jgi:hypothetical protein
MPGYGALLALLGLGALAWIVVRGRGKRKHPDTQDSKPKGKG